MKKRKMNCANFINNFVRIFMTQTKPVNNKNQKDQQIFLLNLKKI